MRRLLCLLIIFCSHTAYAAGLHIEGNRIIAGDREVWLQGVAVGDPLLARADRPLSDYATIAQDWHANLVRISVHPGTWRDEGRKAVMESLQKNVQAALDAGLYVIICWQAIGAPDSYMQPAPDGYVSDLYDTDFALAKDFWKAAAKVFGRDDRIIFELWNEPVWGAQREEGRHLKPKWKQLKPFWEELLAIVRAESGNIVLVTGNGWGYNLQGVKDTLIHDGNVAYAWHVYAGTDDDDPAAWEANLDRLNEIKPVLVTEWGFETAKQDVKYYGTAEKYGYLFADRFIRDKHLHAVAWCWHPQWTPHMLEEDWKTPSMFGAFVKEILWRNNGDQFLRP